MLFAPLAFFLPETMPFLDTDLQTKSDEELASLKVALADLPVPLLSRFWAVLPPAAYSFTASMPRAFSFSFSFYACKMYWGHIKFFMKKKRS